MIRFLWWFKQWRYNRRRKIWAKANGIPDPLIRFKDLPGQNKKGGKR